MMELAHLDREAYRAFRAEVWSRIASRHSEKSSEQISDWVKSSS